MRSSEAVNQTAKQPDGARAVRRGDVLYVSGESGPACGEVLCHGRDGVTVRIDGKPIRVRWHGVLGHKQRIETHANVVDHGDDGAIVEDDEGVRRYIQGLALADELEEEEEAETELSKSDRVLLTKDGSGSAVAGSVAVLGQDDGEDAFAKSDFLLKAKKPVSNKPGLTLRDVPSARTGTVKRWVRNDRDEKGQKGGRDQAEPGSEVRFRSASGHALTGKVVSSGADGVTVRDERGGEHRIRHGDYSLEDAEREARKTRPNRQPKRIDTQAYRSPLRREHFEQTPKNAYQPVENNIEALYVHAKEALPHYQAWAKRIAGSLGGKVVDHNMGEKLDLREEGIQFIIGPTKKRDRVKEKAETEEGGEFNVVKDIIRGTLALDGLDQLPAVWKAFEQSGIELASKPKDRFARPAPSEYRDILLNVTMPNGHICELQVNIKPMLAAKDKVHDLYEKQRTAEGRINKRGDGPTQAERSLLEQLNRKQTIRYRKAWAMITKGLKLASLWIDHAILFLVRKEIAR